MLTEQSFGTCRVDTFETFEHIFKQPADCYVAERVWSNDQKLTTRSDGGLELQFTAISRPEVISWVLSFGREAELLEPVELRRELKALVQELATTYDSNFQIRGN